LAGGGWPCGAAAGICICAAVAGGRAVPPINISKTASRTNIFKMGPKKAGLILTRTARVIALQHPRQTKASPFSEYISCVKKPRIRVHCQSITPLSATFIRKNRRTAIF
jgi:hypothetical protein